MESTSDGEKTTTLLIVMGLLLAITIAIVSANGGVHGIGRNHTGYHDPGDGYGYGYNYGDGHGNGYRNRGIGNGNVGN